MQYMTDSELLHSYRQADDKYAQVRILAELNASSIQTMRGRLIGLGVPSGEMNKKVSENMGNLKQTNTQAWKRTDVEPPTEKGTYFVVVCNLRSGVPVDPKRTVMTFNGDEFEVDHVCVITHWCNAPALPAELEG